jgi:Ca-activated chloride channel family protein
MTLAFGFQTPGWLLTLALLPLVVFAYVALQNRRRGDALRFASLATLASVAPASPGWRRHVPPALLLLSLLALLLALARPEATFSVPRERASVMLVTDTSGSMAATDVEPDRLTAAREAAGAFLDEVPDRIRVGLVAFSSTSAVLQTPTTDRAAVRDGLQTIQAGGGTATGDGIEAGLRALNAQNQNRSEAERIPGAIVLLSDGKATSGADPSGVAQQARQARVPIYTVALGTQDGTILTPDCQELNVPPDLDALREIAAISGGRFFDAPSADALESAYADLGSRLGEEPEVREVTNAFAGGALVLLVLGAGLGLLWFGRVP